LSGEEVSGGNMSEEYVKGANVRIPFLHYTASPGNFVPIFYRF